MSGLDAQAFLQNFERNAGVILGVPDHQRGLYTGHIGRGEQLPRQKALEARQIRRHAFQHEIHLSVEHVTLTHK